MEATRTDTNRSIASRALVLFIPALLFLFFGIITGRLSKEAGLSSKDANRVEREIHRKESQLKEEFDQLEQLFREEAPTDVLDRKSSRYQDLATRRGISIFYYKRGMLTYWSDHSVPVRSRWDQRMRRPFVPMRNADFVSVVRRTTEGMLLGLIEVRTHFPFQNEFLTNGYHPDYALDDDVQLEFLEGAGTEPVLNEDGEYLFSLDFSGASSGNRNLSLLSIICFLLFPIFLYTGFVRIIRRAEITWKWIWSGVLVGLIVGCMVSLLVRGYPPVIADSGLFQPELFASRFFPSLGHLLFLSVALFLMSWLFYRYLDLKQLVRGKWSRILSILLFAGSAILFSVCGAPDQYPGT